MLNQLLRGFTKPQIIIIYFGTIVLGILSLLLLIKYFGLEGSFILGYILFLMLNVIFEYRSDKSRLTLINNILIFFGLIILLFIVIYKLYLIFVNYVI